MESERLHTDDAVLVPARSWPGAPLIPLEVDAPERVNQDEIVRLLARLRLAAETMHQANLELIDRLREMLVDDDHAGEPAGELPAVLHT